MSAPWHADHELLARYRDGRLDVAGAFSVETHLSACAGCRATAGTLVEPERLRQVWDAVADDVDRPPQTVAERSLCRLGAAEHTARLLAVTPALTLPWMTAVAFVLAFVAASAHLRPYSIVAFLLLAPLVPLAGVATAFGPGLDPAYEVGVAAPVRGFRLLLLRAAAVLVVSLAIVSGAALLLPGLGFTAVAWVLPALAVTAAGLAAATVLQPTHAAIATGGVWALVPLGVGLASSQPLAAFGSVAQLVAVGVAVAAAAVVVARADTFDVGGWTGP